MNMASNRNEIPIERLNTLNDGFWLIVFQMLTHIPVYPMKAHKSDKKSTLGNWTSDKHLPYFYRFFSICVDSILIFKVIEF